MLRIASGCFSLLVWELWWLIIPSRSPHHGRASEMAAKSIKLTTIRRALLVDWFTPIQKLAYFHNSNNIFFQRWLYLHMSPTGRVLSNGVMCRNDILEIWAPKWLVKNGRVSKEFLSFAANQPNLPAVGLLVSLCWSGVLEREQDTHRDHCNLLEAYRRWYKMR